MAKRYIQVNWSKSGNSLSVLASSGGATVLTIQSPLPNSPVRVLHDDLMGNHIPDLGIGVDGTGAYYDPGGAARGEEGMITVDSAGVGHTVLSPYHR